MPDVLERPEIKQQQTRTIQLREIAETEDGSREFSAIGVPFGEPYDFGYWVEEFDPECEFVGLERAKLLYQHRDVIGTIPTSERTDAGMVVHPKISRTERGNEVYVLLKDGAVDSMSIGFTPLEYLVREDDGAIVYTRVRVDEFSLTHIPAYSGAVVTDVRHDRRAQPSPERNDAMPPETLTREDFDTEMQRHRAEQTREFETLLARSAEAGAGDAPIGAQWRSAGDFLKAVASGDQAAADFHRAYTGGTFADSAPRSTWIADAIKLVEERRRIINRYSRQTLPAEGMTLEYVKLKSNSIVVEPQAKEGDTLAFGKIALDTDTAKIGTYGGYTTLSRQAIERSSAPLLTTALTAMDIAYAKATEAGARALLLATIEAQKTAGNKIAMPAEFDVFDWLDAIVDASEAADARGFIVAGLQASKDVFKQLYRLADSTGRPLMTITGQGVNQVGTLRAGDLSAELANLEVSLIPNAPAGTASFYDPVAITTFEQPGAPVQLQDENIINLTKDFSKYGYVAFASQFPTALQPLEFAAAPATS